MIKPNYGISAVLYLRLSKDEAKRSESLSITIQRRILMDYADTNGFLVTGEYVDDGISGVNFDRAGFVQMIEDGKAKKFDVIIIKDLSRLARDHIGAGEHIEKTFPAMGIRFISLAENYDSNKDDPATSDMVPFFNLFNEFHAKSTSRKTKTTKISMAKAGKFQGCKAPYGYRLDPADKYHLLVDQEAAETVAVIFNLACDGYGYKAVARILRDEKRLNPSAYCNQRTPGHYKSEYWKQPHDWHPSSVKTILHNQSYLGNLVSGKRRVESFKTKKPVKMPEDTWIVVENTHEAIVSKAVWKKAHEKLAVRTRCDNQGAIQMFAGLVKCYDCGYALAYSQSCKDNQSPRYQCSLYNVKGKAYCKSHFITYNDLYKIVLDDLRRRARAAAQMDTKLMSRLQEEAAADWKNQRILMEQEVERFQARIQQIDEAVPQIYEDSLAGLSSREHAVVLIKKYEGEQQELRQRQGDFLEKLKVYGDRFSELELFTKEVARYEDVPSLNATILNELISEIRVGAKANINGEKQQKVKIIYNQTSYVEFLEDVDLGLCDTGKGDENEAFREIIKY